jgi:hypothetical protein
MTLLNKIKKGIVLVALFQSCNISSVEKQIVKNEDTSSFENENSISSLLIDTFLISNFSVNGLGLGMLNKNVKKQLLLCDSIYCDSINASDGAIFCYVYYQGEIIMSYNFYDSSITWIDVFSPLFHTKGGFRVGDNIKELIDSTNTKIEDGFLILEKKETFWIGLYFKLEGFIDYIGFYDTGGFP